MSVLCINCGKADLRPDTVRLAGVVRSEPYWVEMMGVKCPNCGYSTVDAKGMTEFSRLLSDKYRAEHGLLTSEQILAHREGHFKESQEQFAKRCGIGVATLKRIEKGKIQDEDTNRRIIENTKTPVVNSDQFVYANIECNSTINCGGGVPPTNRPTDWPYGIGTNYTTNTGSIDADVANTVADCGVIVLYVGETNGGQCVPVAKASPSTLAWTDINPLIAARGSHAR
jgi:DNA-binding transcriptional regulator YiaG